MSNPQEEPMSKKIHDALEEYEASIQDALADQAGLQVYETFLKYIQRTHEAKFRLMALADQCQTHEQAMNPPKQRDFVFGAGVA